MVMIICNEPFKSRFISSLTNILHTTSSSYIIKLVISLLGKLGGRTRTLLKDRIDLASYSFSRKLLLQYDEHSYLPMDSYIILTVSLLERNLIVKSLEDSEVTLSRMLHCTRSSIARLRSIRRSYKLTATRSLEHVFYLCCEGKEIIISPSNSYQLKTNLCSTKSIRHPTSDQCQQDEIISLLFYGLVLACCDIEIRDEAFTILQRIACYMVGLLINYTGKGQIDPPPSIPSQYLYAVSQDALGVVPIPFPLTISFPPDILSPELLVRVIAVLLEREIPNAVEVVLDISNYMTDILIDMISNKRQMLWEIVPTVEFFITTIMKHAVISNWRCKVAIGSIFNSR